MSLNKATVDIMILELNYSFQKIWEAMGILKLPVVLIVLFVALNHLEGGGKPTERLVTWKSEFLLKVWKRL